MESSHALRTGHDFGCSSVYGRCPSWESLELFIASHEGRAIADLIDKSGAWWYDCFCQNISITSEGTYPGYAECEHTDALGDAIEGLL